MLNENLLASQAQHYMRTNRKAVDSRAGRNRKWKGTRKHMETRISRVAAQLHSTHCSVMIAGLGLLWTRSRATSSGGSWMQDSIAIQRSKREKDELLLWLWSYRYRLQRCDYVFSTTFLTEKYWAQVLAWYQIIGNFLTRQLHINLNFANAAFWVS